MRTALLLGNNPLSLAGGPVTTAAGVIMIGYRLYELFGHAHENPYLGRIFLLILPALFILGLALIPVGIFFAAGRLQMASAIPQIDLRVDLNDRICRHCLDIVLVVRS